jgi:hypothetical protein
MKRGASSGLPDGTNCIFKMRRYRYINVAVQIRSYTFWNYDFIKITDMIRIILDR